MPIAESWRDWAVIGRFAALHLAALSVFLVPFDWSLPAWLVGSYLLRMFGVTAGYHRYFSHRSYKLGRASQVAMAFLAQTSAQKGVLWWAAHYRDHHKHSDREADVRHLYGEPWRRLDSEAKLVSADREPSLPRASVREAL
jgi:fatty-acid desaturase